MKLSDLVKRTIKIEVFEYKLLLRSVPSIVMVLFVMSITLMNLLANREISLNLSWLALDCGFTVSWMSFLAMDMLTKRFGPKAAIKLSVLACGINLIMCIFLYLITLIPGCWGEFYNYSLNEVNFALDNTFGGTWYVIVGSTIAFVTSSIVNALINHLVGRRFSKTSFKEYAIRSYVSTMIGQFVDNLVFALVVSHTFFGWSMIQCITCSVTGCLLELMCEVLLSPIGYKVCKKWEKEDVGKEYIQYAKIRRKNTNV